ncbi:MAG TPA: glycosyltransferase family 1 protein, partial [Aggregatilineales bacterium]|nr:glycosyltransferase family 1 protein [Aggregatilineales bacterium]
VRVPETASPSLKKYLDVVVPRSIARATHIHAVSEATRQDIITLYNTPPSKISVIFNAVESRFKPTEMTKDLLTKYQIPDVPYIVTVGTVQPRKNYSRLVKALIELRKNHDVHLVVAGGRGWLEDEFYATIRDTHMTDYVHITGFVADEDLPALYSGAVCMAFPSLYEGFGIPVLEAMGCGVPVVSSNTSSLPEVVEDAAILVDPYSTDQIHEALERVITDQSLRKMLIECGLIQAKKFTWE